ncbi:MAG: hypothetical protein HRT35_13590 [Algicola sp.]|nr:hypothetical protein [Algicola sp.]
MQSKNIIRTIIITSVFLVVYFVIDTPSNDESAVEQSHQTKNEIEPKPAAKDELVLTNPANNPPKTKSDSAQEQSPSQKDVNTTAAKSKLLLKTDTAEQRWTPYIDKTSEHYEKLMALEKEASGPFVIGDIGYFKVLSGDEYVFFEASEKTVEQTKDPFTVYNRHLDDLNNLEEYGDWSAESEQRVRNLFLQYYRGGSYDITAMQCREKTCLLEFSFTQYMDGVVKFLNTLHDNYAACRCVLLETAWPEERLAIIKIIFRD